MMVKNLPVSEAHHCSVALPGLEPLGNLIRAVKCPVQTLDTKNYRRPRGNAKGIEQKSPFRRIAMLLSADWVLFCLTSVRFIIFVVRTYHLNHWDNTYIGRVVASTLKSLLYYWYLTGYWYNVLSQSWLHTNMGQTSQCKSWTKHSLTTNMGS